MNRLTIRWLVNVTLDKAKLASLPPGAILSVPRETEVLTVEELIGQGVVGLYLTEDKPVEFLTEFWRNYG